MPIPKIYLAGPDVFLPDALHIADQKKAICRAHGLQGMFPLDVELDTIGLSPEQLALAISHDNEALMRQCDAIVANLTPFRGPNADPGTAFEMGFMRALGRPVFAYSNDTRSLLDRVRRTLRTHATERFGRPATVDEHDMTIEDWGFKENLMLEGAVRATAHSIVTQPRTNHSYPFEDLEAFKTCVAQASARLLRQP